ncbi:hypothetical protein [Parvularcula marina]|uniref:hypothetical protein n=1 Tax=Parvularcula marina TaxID=2292771 RepID=UPI0035128748
MSENPPRGTHFQILGWRLMKANRVAFLFDCDVYGAFEETVDFPGPDGALARLAESEGREILTLLGVALGVSSYKLAAAPRIALPPLSPAGKDMARALYTDGLAEFYVRNTLPWPADIIFDGPDLPGISASEQSFEGPALVAFGGGKDSYVARAILREAQQEVQLTSVVLGDAVRHVLSATAPEDVLFIDRRLDPKLYEVAPRAFGGHVPITAINMLILAVTAVTNGYGSVVFANERSADEPTMQIEGSTPANHQYSKSSHFETLINAALKEAHPAPPPVFSILRPFSELWIGRGFAGIKDAFGRFTSCNRNFRLAGDADKRWCGACAKCAFTSLILAPFITKEEAETIFNGQFLDRDTLLPLYRELLGLTEHKPWDCVGTIEECRAALWGASKGAFADTKAVHSFLPPLIDEMGTDGLEAAWAHSLARDDAFSLPSGLLAAAEKVSQ